VQEELRPWAMAEAVIDVRRDPRESFQFNESR
jgi:hypothetical protein